MTQKNNIGYLISSLAAVLLGSMLTAQYYKDEVGPIESLKNRVSIVTLLLAVIIILNSLIVGVLIW